MSGISCPLLGLDLSLDSCRIVESSQFFNLGGLNNLQIQEIIRSHLAHYIINLLFDAKLVPHVFLV